MHKTIYDNLFFIIMKKLWKESLNSDGHQYQQNEQSSLILTGLTEHKKDHDVGNPGPGIRQAQKCG